MADESGSNPPGPDRDVPSASPSQDPGKKSRRSRILLVEDSRGDVLLVQSALAECGIDAELTVKLDGEEMIRHIDAMDALQAPCPDLILLDLNLPRRNGMEVLFRMRNSPLCGSVPVIIVSSSDAAKDREAVSRLGATAYFRKPSDYDEFMRLGELVRKTLQEKIS